MIHAALIDSIFCSLVIKLWNFTRTRLSAITLAIPGPEDLSDFFTVFDKPIPIKILPEVSMVHAANRTWFLFTLSFSHLGHRLIFNDNALVEHQIKAIDILVLLRDGEA